MIQHLYEVILQGSAWIKLSEFQTKSLNNVNYYLHNIYLQVLNVPWEEPIYSITHASLGMKHPEIRGNPEWGIPGKTNSMEQRWAIPTPESESSLELTAFLAFLESESESE